MGLARLAYSFPYYLYPLFLCNYFYFVGLQAKWLIYKDFINLTGFLLTSAKSIGYVLI
jgi:hypothetical protein